MRDMAEIRSQVDEHKKPRVRCKCSRCGTFFYDRNPECDLCYDCHRIFAAPIEQEIYLKHMKSSDITNRSYRWGNLDESI